MKYKCTTKELFNIDVPEPSFVVTTKDTAYIRIASAFISIAATPKGRMAYRVTILAYRDKYTDQKPVFLLTPKEAKCRPIVDCLKHCDGVEKLVIPENLLQVLGFCQPR